jgi:hypothetical protein
MREYFFDNKSSPVGTSSNPLSTDRFSSVFEDFLTPLTTNREVCSDTESNPINLVHRPDGFDHLNPSTCINQTPCNQIIYQRKSSRASQTFW